MEKELMQSNQERFYTECMRSILEW